MDDIKDNLVVLEDVKKYFPLRHGPFRRLSGHVRAVDGVSLAIPGGMTVGLMGQSGCGKTTLARTILCLIPADSGRILFNGLDILSLKPVQLRPLRRNMQIIFQDPCTSLDPRMTVGDIISEPLVVHRIGTKSHRWQRTVRLLETVGLAGDCINRFGHEFSAGQRQRIAIARALATEPQFIICDEPTSSLDISTQLQIISLLCDLQRQLKLTYLFISHNPAVIEYVSDFTAVMYEGRIVEYAPARRLFADPLHPYTKFLLASARRLDPGKTLPQTIRQDCPDSLSETSTGCAFYPQCPFAAARCKFDTPTLKTHDGGHLTACWKI